MKRLLILASLISASLFGQSFSNPLPVNGLNARYFGDTGGATNTSYYVQAIYTTGRSVIAGPITITTPAARSSNNRVLVTWDKAPGAISYDVLTNTTGTTPSGACNCALIVATTNNSLTDIGQPSLLYTTDTPNTLPVTMTTGNSAFQMTLQAATDTGALTASQMLNGLLVGTPTGAASYTTPSATALEAGMSSCVVGRTYPLFIKNTSAGNFAITVLAGMGVTVSGTATVAQNAVREFLIYVTSCSSPAVTVYSLSTGAF